MASHHGTYDEALTRLHRTGPEFDGWLSNHGPMVVEAMDRRGGGARIHRWTDQYLQRLEDLPRGITPISEDDWQEALGDSARLGDWIRLMARLIRERPWQETLTAWWPRLLPGIAAGATHGVIRVGHAVQALRAEETPPRIDELGQALAYWAARWEPVPMIEPRGRLTPAAALAVVPAIANQSSGIQNRLVQLGATPGWKNAVRALDPESSWESVIDAAVLIYARWAHGQPTMLVHAATAPAAVARALPALPAEFAPSSMRAAWAASCAVVAAYRPHEDQARPALQGRSADELWLAALDHGGEHVIKLADTALQTAARSGDDSGLVATLRAIELDA